MRRVWLLLLFTLAVGSVWMLSHHLNTNWAPTHIFRYNSSTETFEYTGADGVTDTFYNCSAILEEDKEALEKAKLLTADKQFRRTVQIPDEYYTAATRDCKKFQLSRKYLTVSSSQEEEDFPLAYSIVVHHKVQNFERLLRAIYVPHNLYCIHVDKNSEPLFHSAVMAITSCFPNVFMVSQPVSVVYAAWPRVQADLNCMADLYKASTKWKYFINLCGQDFPLKTNLEMVRMLRSLRGSNSLESEQMPEGKKRRVKTSHKIVNGKIQRSRKAKDSPPFNLPIMSGNAYIVVSRGYVRSVLEDSRIQSLIEWAKDTYSPDEFLWATIQRMPGVPGSTRPHPKYDMSDMHAVARLVKWDDHEGSEDDVNAVYPKCHGNHVRGICVYGPGDLKWMIEQHHLFANKFDMDTDPITVYCLEEYLRQKEVAKSHRVYCAWPQKTFNFKEINQSCNFSKDGQI